MIAIHSPSFRPPRRPPVRSGATTPGRSDAGSAGLIVYDADISRELHGASIVEETALRGAPLTAAAAYLSFAVAEAGGDPARRHRGPRRRPLAGRPAHGDHICDRGSRRHPVDARRRGDQRPCERRGHRRAGRSGTSGRGIRSRRGRGADRPLRHDPRPPLAAHRARARRDPAAARRRLAAGTRRVADGASRCTTRRPTTTLDAVGHPAPQHDPAVQPRARRFPSGCATTCPIRSTWCCTRPPTTCGSSSRRRPR